MSKLSLHQLKSNQHHFICFSRDVRGCGQSHLIQTIFHTVRSYFYTEVVTQPNQEIYYLHLQVLLQLIFRAIQYI